MLHRSCSNRFARPIKKASHWLALAVLAVTGSGASLAETTSASATAPVVTIADGVLKGRSEGGVDSFRGVPFAAPPVGPLRWRAPQPEAHWSGVRDATRFGPDCEQWGLDNPPNEQYIRPTSEDCLTLNVWRPAGAKPSDKLPVMVWIFGGAFSMGSASYPVYDGSYLASQGVIVVTVNYRLARFGFFAHPALSKANADNGLLGNYGLMDQIAGLHWVQDNIAAFGGDPGHVTLFGESAGAFSVNALVASPLARGLFAQAISESGGGQRGMGRSFEDPLTKVEQKGLEWTRSLGIADDDLAAMRALPAATVLGPRNPRVLGALMVDGKVIPQPVDDAFRKGEIAHVPMIIGANSWEYSLLEYLPGMEKWVMKGLGKEGPTLLSLYKQDGAKSDSEAMKRMWGDAFMVAPARYLARQVTAGGQPAYLYHFSYVPVAARGTIPGAQHSAEMSFVFHNEVKGAQFKEGAADSAMGRTMSGYWLRFAKTGNPNGDGAPEWPRYDAQSDRLLDFTNEGPVVRSKFHAHEFDLLDKAYLDRIGVSDTPGK